MISHWFQFDVVCPVVPSVLDLLRICYCIIISSSKLLESHSFFVELEFLGMWPYSTFLMVTSMILEKAMAPHSSTLAWKIPWMEEPGRLQSMGSLRVGMTERLHFHFSLSCIAEGNGNPLQCLAWRIPRTTQSDGLPSLGSHKVRHDWSDLAAAAACFLAGWGGEEVWRWCLLGTCAYNNHSSRLHIVRPA